jgi:hypothetical protein
VDQEWKFLFLVEQFGCYHDKLLYLWDPVNLPTGVPLHIVHSTDVSGVPLMVLDEDDYLWEEPIEQKKKRRTMKAPVKKLEPSVKRIRKHAQKHPLVSNNVAFRLTKESEVIDLTGDSD